jgi:hypothetical protein
MLRKVTGSVALMPKSRLDMTRVRISAPTKPTTRPAPTSFSPDLARLLRHGITHHAVNTHRREDERQARKDREQEHAETLPCDRARDDVFH